MPYAAETIEEFRSKRRDLYYRNKDAVRLYQGGKRALIDEIKSQPCTDCRQSYPPYVMDFDHLDPEQKLFTIGRGVSVGTIRLREEMAKCEVVCSNCHRIREHDRRQYHGTEE